MAAKSFARPRLHHVNLKTCRMDAMIDWYGKVIGASLQHRFPGGAFLTNDEANHRVALLTSSKLCDDDAKLTHSGMHHFSFEYASLDDLLDNYQRLSAMGIEPHACLDHGMTLSMYFVDPDGNSVELQVDNFGDWTRSSEFIQSSPEFERDPIGTPFDPKQVVTARQAGASKADLHRRAYSGEFKPSTPLDLRFPAD